DVRRHKGVSLVESANPPHRRQYVPDRTRAGRARCKEGIMLKRIWLAPPLAFARVGGSPTPSCAFTWSADDLTPEGTGQTTLRIAETIDLDADGIPTRADPDRIVFRDADGIRPVCPYFELHGTWTEGRGDVSGPITKSVLERFGIGVRDIRWDVHSAQ